MPTNPVKLSGVNGALLPNIVTEAIFVKATEKSAVMSLGRRVPLAMNVTTAIPIPGGVPLAGFVAEGGKKPLGSSNVGFKSISGKKLAVLVPVSAELATTNSGGLYDQLVQDLPTALARAFDFTAIHGIDLVSGAVTPYNDYLTETSKSITLGTTTTANGGYWADLVSAESTVIDDDWDFTGWIGDRRLRPKLKLQTDLQGRPVYMENSQLGDIYSANTSLAGNLNGYPIAYTPSVSGKMRRQPTTTDSGLRAIGGDFSQVAFGVGMDITLKVSDSASYMDEDGVVHSAFQENLVLLLAEAYYGLVIADTSAFVKIYNATTTPPTLSGISPTSGARSAATNVTLTGTNFLPSPTVAVSGTGVTVSGVTRVSGTSITATFTQSGSAALTDRDVKVTNTDGSTVTLVDSYTVTSS